MFSKTVGITWSSLLSGAGSSRLSKFGNKNDSSVYSYNVVNIVIVSEYLETLFYLIQSFKRDYILEFISSTIEISVLLYFFVGET
jgi:hypothetical protein